MSVVIQVDNLSKYYRLGLIGGGTLREDLNRWWAKARGRPDPLLKIGDTDHGNRVGGELWALRDVSFQVREGEILGIIGRNGAGKSTLLKILSRITAPTTGQVKIKGRVGSLLEVGTGFHPELTGRENIYLNGAILGMKKAEIDRKLDEIIDFAEIEQFIDTPVKRYSSGMYVRLAFAVAAHLEPEILIVDEVLAVGDAAFQKKCLGKMDDVSKRSGRTVLFVSHNMSAIQELCPRCLLLATGQIKSDNKTARIMKDYISIVEESAEVDLTNVTQHGPKLYSRLLKLAIFNANQELTTAFKMGDALIARISFEITNPVKSVEIGLKVSTRFGAAIHYFTSTWENFFPDFEKGKHCVEVTIPNMVLLPGSYTLGIWILKGNEWSDVHAQEVTSITVSKGNVPINPARIDQYVVSGGEVYSPSQWRTLPTNLDFMG